MVILLKILSGVVVAIWGFSALMFTLIALSIIPTGTLGYEYQVGYPWYSNLLFMAIMWLPVITLPLVWIKEKYPGSDYGTRMD